MLRLTSAGISSRGTIPDRYTCEGRNVSPPLTWHDAPEETASFVLVMDDPDAPNGPFAHWIVYNIPPLHNELAEGFSPDVGATEGIVEGRNDFGNARYGGPCPPVGGDAHHYHIRLYALDRELTLGAGATRAQIMDAIHDHILDQTELVATFARSTS